MSFTMNKNLNIILLILFLSMTFINTQTIDKVSSYPYAIASIELSPNPIVYGQNMSVKVQFDCNSNVSVAKLYLFKITEDMICLCDYVYISMHEIPTLIRCPTSVRYEGNYTVDFPVGMQIGFRIQIYYDNATIAYVPNLENFMGLPTIEPINNEIMFDAGKVQNGTNSMNLNFLYALTSVLVVSIILVKRRKSKLN